MKNLRFTLFAFFASAAGSIFANPMEEGVVILGEIKSSAGKPIVAKIYITDVCTNQMKEIQTDGDKGTFQFQGGECQTYIVEAKALGFKSNGQVVTIGADKMLVLNLKMEEEKIAEDKNKPTKGVTI
ncbi:MAG: carboxypeptidase regulatory-like domain-containing protein [Bacteroidetes bacterium]|nr:carboxypeptidase regulatory-like domain-containing protein [Bacteroidota bacterium]